MNTTVESDSGSVLCTSSHLTSFAVLVDVNGLEARETWSHDMLILTKLIQNPCLLEKKICVF